MHFQRRHMLGWLSASIGGAVLPLTSAQQISAAESVPSGGSEKVTGIGGLFFRARDPKALALWYQQHLGVSVLPTSSGDSVWQQEAGPTAFAPFPEKTKYFGDDSKSWMVNFRVRDLDKMAAQLESAGITVKIDPKTYPNGRFARLHDPEGNPIELWQPAEKR